VKVNDQDLHVEAAPLSYLVLKRAWHDGDTISLALPMQVSVRTWKKNQNAVSVDYGPLTFSLKIQERWSRCGGSDQWPEFEVFPNSPWNYGLELNSKHPVKSFKIRRKPGALAAQPFTPDAAPIELQAEARRIPAWVMDKHGLAGKLQPSPAKSSQPKERITLIPMGAARLRISAFPVIGHGPEAHEWTATAEN
jgi:hypothetical protein